MASAKTIKTSLSGAIEVPHKKYKPGTKVVLVIVGDVKAEPHHVATATSGTETKMSIRLNEAVVLEGGEANDWAETVAAANSDGDDEPLPLT